MTHANAAAETTLSPVATIAFLDKEGLIEQADAIRANNPTFTTWAAANRQLAEWAENALRFVADDGIPTAEGQARRGRCGWLAEEQKAEAAEFLAKVSFTDAPPPLPTNLPALVAELRSDGGATAAELADDLVAAADLATVANLDDYRRPRPTPEPVTAHRARKPDAQDRENSRTWTGDRFDRDRDLRDTAKLIRGDIAAAVKAGDLPRGQYSVRLSRYSQGQSIDVRVIELHQPVLVANPARVRQDDRQAPREPIEPLYSAPGQAILDRLEAIQRRYNRRHGRHLHFYGYPEFGGGFLSRGRAFVRGIDPRCPVTVKDWRA
ncbi:MAG: hypothetical protein GY719_25750 [bacterium]|nr:hypothetical protein [bacterium]